MFWRENKQVIIVLSLNAVMGLSVALFAVSMNPALSLPNLITIGCLTDAFLNLLFTFATLAGVWR